MNDQKIYDEILLEHNLHPQHKCKIAKANFDKKITNASCGDELEIELLIKDGKIIDGGFRGEGCAIAQASADLMLGAVIGKTKEAAEELALTIEDLMVGREVDKNLAEKLGEARALAQVARMPARVKCAKLAWKAVEKDEEKAGSKERL